MFTFKDLIRYNSGWLALMSFYAKGTEWTMSFPAYRTQIDAVLAGQKMLDRL